MLVCHARSAKIRGTKRRLLAGWWFGTWSVFFHMLGIIIRIDWYFSEGLKPPTNWRFTWRVAGCPCHDFMKPWTMDSWKAFLIGKLDWWYWNRDVKQRCQNGGDGGDLISPCLCLFAKMGNGTLHVGSHVFMFNGNIEGNGEGKQKPIALQTKLFVRTVNSYHTCLTI